MFNPARLSFARRRRGLTKKRLAKAVRLSTRSLTAHEAGEIEPSDETVTAFARELEFPREFFLDDDDIDEVAEDGASFRSLSRLTAGQKASALAAASLAVSVGRWIEAKFTLPQPNVPEFAGTRDPTSAAINLRAVWGMGQGPVKNLVHLLEAHGVRVFSLTDDCRFMDAISLWDNNTPYVFLNTIKSAERSRFDAAHELGHLVMHRHGGIPMGRRAEEEANIFASTFLMPKDSVLARVPANPSLTSIMDGKEYWGVSAMAYAYRLRRVGALTDWYYHQLARQLSIMGLRSSEGAMKREASQVLRKVFDGLRSIGMSKPAVARELSITTRELDRFVFGLVMTGIDGEGGGPGRGGGGEPKQRPAGAGRLRLLP